MAYKLGGAVVIKCLGLPDTTEDMTIDWGARLAETAWAALGARIGWGWCCCMNMGVVGGGGPAQESNDPGIEAARLTRWGLGEEDLVG